MPAHLSSRPSQRSAWPQNLSMSRTMRMRTFLNASMNIMMYMDWMKNFSPALIHWEVPLQLRVWGEQWWAAVSIWTYVHVYTSGQLWTYGHASTQVSVGGYASSSRLQQSKPVSFTVTEPELEPMAALEPEPEPMASSEPEPEPMATPETEPEPMGLWHCQRPSQRPSLVILHPRIQEWAWIQVHVKVYDGICGWS